MSKVADALRQTADCLEDVANGKGGWAWEEVLQEARAALAADGEDVRELVTLLNEAGEQIERSALNIRSASGHRAAKYHFDLHSRISAALAKHAPPKEKP